MAVIQQGNTYKTVIGWYGDCDDECQDLNLSAYKSQLTAVYQWDTGGALKVWKSNLPDSLNRSFKSLECGKIYYLYVKPGTGSFTVPNFVVSSYETQDAGRVAASCQPTPTPERTPTPIPCNCASSDYTIVKPTSLNYVTNGHTFGAFESGTTIAYKSETLQSTVASELNFIYPNGVTAGIIVFTSKKPSNTEFIIQRGITCYTATATDSNKVGDDKWELNLVVSEQLSDKCGDEQPLTTPTPKPATYSLSANPTSVSEGQSFSVTLNTANVENGATIPYTITGIEASDISQSLTGNFIINNNSASQTFNVVADQLTEGNQTFKLKLNNNLAEVSVAVQDTSKTQPTPTPKPPSECCTSNTTSYNTNGEFEATLINQKLPGQDIATTIVDYKLWEAGGKLCIDTKLVAGNVEGPSGDTDRYFILPGLPSGSTPTGAINKVYKNGVSTFYYVRPNGDCYTGEYTDAGTDVNNPVVLTKTTGSFDPDPTPTPKPIPTYSLSANPTSVSEGGQFNVLLQTENVENGTIIPYTITGIESSDISESLTGNFTIRHDGYDDGGDIKLFYVRLDQLTEGNQTFKLKLNNNQAEVSVVIQDTSKSVPTYSLSVNPTDPTEGTRFRVMLNTTNVEDGTTLLYTITGIEASDILESLTGFFSVVNNVSTIFINIRADQLTEGNQTLTLKLNNNQASVSVVIQDTSKTQPTPTPKPPSECCTSNTTSYNTNGEFEATLINQKLPGQDIATTIVDYKLWEAGGKLCIDTNITSDNVEGPTGDTDRYFILPGLPSGSIPTGTLNKVYKNGVSTFYYTRPNGDCYTGEYTDAGTDVNNPVVLTKTTGSFDPDPTPTPVAPTPTPVAPTPTPEKPNQLAFRWASISVQGIGTREVLQVKNLLKPTHSNFSHYLETGPWMSVYGFTGNDGSYSLSNAFWPDAAVSANYNDHFSTISFDGLQFSLGSEETDDTIGKYKQLKVSLSSEVEFSHDSNESSPSALFMYKEDTNNENTALGASASWPVIVKKPSVVPAPNVTGLKCNEASSTETRLHFEWVTDNGARTFTLELATDSSFQNIVSSNSSYNANQESISGLNSGTTYYFRVKGNPINNETTKSAEWAVVSGTTKSEQNDPTPTPADCSCIPSGYTNVEISSSSVVNASGGHVLAEFEKGSIVAWDSSTLVNGFAGIFFQLPNSSASSMIMFNGKVPKNTNFYYKTSTGCYKATVTDDQKTSSGYMVTWTLVRQLPSACEDASFNEEINCCTDSETNITVFLGKGEPQNGISGILTHGDGKMDGNLCFTATPVSGVDLQLPHTVYLENQPSDMAFKIELSRDYDGIKFIYRLKTGECYEGYLNDSRTTTFTEII